MARSLASTVQLQTGALKIEERHWILASPLALLD
jgi:hypothetical protein